MSECVYLLHFDQPLGSERHRAQHYIGWAKRLDARLAHHAAGAGARITAAAAGAGVTWQLARTWTPGDRTLERQLKRQHHHSRYCPICTPQEHA